MNSKYDPEGWEREYWIYQEERWDDLVELRKEEAKGSDYRDGPYEELADALILAKRYEEAIKILTELYKEDHTNRGVNNLILQVLKETNKEETDFVWIEKPEILRLDENLFQYCLLVLKKERKVNRNITEIKMALDRRDIFMDFEMDEFEEWLNKDDRLKFIKDENNISTRIEILSGRKKK